MWKPAVVTTRPGTIRSSEVSLAVPLLSRYGWIRPLTPKLGKTTEAVLSRRISRGFVPLAGRAQVLSDATRQVGSMVKDRYELPDFSSTVTPLQLVAVDACSTSHHFAPPVTSSAPTMATSTVPAAQICWSATFAFGVT